MKTRNGMTVGRLTRWEALRILGELFVFWCMGCRFTLGIRKEPKPRFVLCVDEGKK